MAIFNKGFASLKDRAIIHDHLLTPDRRSGLNPLAKAHYRLECEDSAFGVATIFPGQGFAYCENAKKDSTLWRVRSEFSYMWNEDFVLSLPFITIHFRTFIPPTLDELQALYTTANMLLHQNRLLQRMNEELVQANAALQE